MTNPHSLASVEIEKTPVQQFVLDNGLRLLIQEDHAIPAVSVQAWCQTGSITEGKFLGSGASHILEHMLFKGTKKRGVSQLAKDVQAIGGSTNAYTSFDRTVYYIDAPSQGWETALEILCDQVFHSTLPKDEYVKEMEVVRREFAMGLDDPGRVLFNELFSTAFVKHPYKHPVIGHLEVYNRLTREDVLEYYHARYVPNNLTFIITGDVSAQEVQSRLEALTKDLPRVGLPDTYIPDEPRQLSRRESRKPFPTDIFRMIMAYHIPAITHPDIYALDVLALIAGQGRSSRLHVELVEKEKLVQSVSAFSYTPAQAGLWAVSSAWPPSADHPASKIESEISKLLEDFKTHPVTLDEIEKAKRQALSDRAAELKTVSGRAASIGGGWFVARDIDFSDNYLIGIQNVTAEDIQRVAQTYFTPSNLTVASLEPDKLKGAESKTSSKADRAPLSVEKLTNGIPVVFQQDRKVPLVSIRAIIRGGILAETPEDNGIGKLTTRLLTKGTAKRDVYEIGSQIENLGGTIDADFGNNTFSVAVELLQPDIETGIDILTDVLFAPSFPQEEIDKEKNKQLTDIKLERDQPMAIARNTMRTNLFGAKGYGLNSNGTPESLKKITRDQIVAYHQSLLSQGNIIFAIGGSFDPSETLKLLNQYTTNVKLSESKPFKPGEPFNKEAIGKKIVVPTDKVQAIVEVGFPSVTLSDPDRAALEIIDQALSGLGSRLFDRIRERQSLAYFVGTSQLVGVEPGYFLYYAGTEKTKSEKVRTEILDEIKYLSTKGFSDDEVKRAKAQLLGHRILQDQSSGIIAFKAALNELYGLGSDFESKFNEKIQSLTTEDVNKVFSKHFAGDNFITVIVQPETKDESTHKKSN